MASQLSTIKKLIKSLDSTSLLGSKALDEAVKSMSNFSSWQSVIDTIVKDCAVYDGHYEDFLKDQCGIVLDNSDIGAITGSDAGGASVKNAESIVPESGDWTYPDDTSVTINGLTVKFPAKSTLSEAQQWIVGGLYTWWIKGALDLVNNSYGMNFAESGTTVKTIEVKFENSYNNSLLAYVSYDRKQKTSKLYLTINMKKYRDIDQSDPNGYSEDAPIYLDRTIAHEMTHATMAANIRNFSELPSWVKEGGSAELIHGVDDTRDLTDLGYEYSGGFVRMRYMAHHSSLNARDFIKTFMKCLVDAGGQASGLDYAIKTATHGCFGGLEDFESRFEEDSSAGEYDNFLRSKCGIELENDDTGAITGFDAGSGPSKDKYNTMREASRPANWRLPTSASTLINGLEVIWPTHYAAAVGGGLSFHVGAQANDRINVGLFNMTTQYIGLTDENGKNISVRTQKDANEILTHLDHVLEVVLDQQTMLGALQKRLESTSKNVQVSTDNTRASESTIRDADMAREMTAYTKHNVLTQAAQSMLAQANQNLQQSFQALVSGGVI